MGVAWTRLGTVTVTAGSVNVQGVDTRWQTAASIGDAFHAPDGKQYEVADITSDTALQLRTPYQGATAAGQAYAIMRIVPQGSDAETMALLRQALNLTDTQLSAFMAWADSQGVVSISDGETNLVGLHGLRKLMADIAAAYPKTGGVVSGPMTVEAQLQASQVLINTANPHLVGGVASRLGVVALLGQFVFGGYSADAFLGTKIRLLNDNNSGGCTIGVEGSASARAATLVISSDGNSTAFDAGGVERLRINAGGGVSTADPLKPGQFTLATLPSASAYNGYTITVSNATGGPALCLSTGAAWINVRTNAPVN